MEKYKESMTYGKEDFDRELRTIKARDVEFTKEQMRSFRIKGIFNAVGEIENMGDDYIRGFANSVFKPEFGEITVIETSIRTFSGGKNNPLKIVSVIVFEDIWSWNMFAMKNQDTYVQKKHMGGYQGLEHLLN